MTDNNTKAAKVDEIEKLLERTLRSVQIVCATKCALGINSSAIVQEFTVDLVQDLYVTLKALLSHIEGLEWKLGNVQKALEYVIASTHSHIDEKDLLAEIHPRNTLDIKRRVDGQEKWFEADWLTGLMEARDYAQRQLDRVPKDFRAVQNEFHEVRMSEAKQRSVTYPKETRPENPNPPKSTKTDR